MTTDSPFNFRSLVVGTDLTVPLLDGQHVTYVSLDNAASTPPFSSVQQAVDRFTPWYSSVHRGSGYKSLISTRAFEQARVSIGQFVGADPAKDVVIFGKNASEAINKLAHRFPFSPGDCVLATVMEHHSNDLPWRAVAEVLYADICPDGSLYMEDLEAKLRLNAGRVRLVTVTGASNVTGFIPDVHAIARLAHQYGAYCMVDAAQLFPHRKIDMGPHDSDSHIDFLALAGHKAYAPFGAGALIGPREILNIGEPEYRGGGTIDLVTLEEVDWADTPERDEAGSPNVVGVVALAAAIQQMQKIGMDHLAQHEAELTRYCLEQLNKIPQITLYGSRDVNRLEDRLGVLSFNLKGFSHGLLAAILGFEGGIGVRNGCFCAHPYVVRLLKVSEEEFSQFRTRVLQKDRTDLPGMVRASFGCYNTLEDIDRLVVMLKRIIAGDYSGRYTVDPKSGSYFPLGYTDAMISVDHSF